MPDFQLKKHQACKETEHRPQELREQTREKKQMLQPFELVDKNFKIIMTDIFQKIQEITYKVYEEMDNFIIRLKLHNHIEMAILELKNTINRN